MVVQNFKLEARQKNAVRVTMFLQGPNFVKACEQRRHTFNTTTTKKDLEQISVFTQPDNVLIGVYVTNRRDKMLYEDISHSIEAGINILLGLQKDKPQNQEPAKGYIPQAYNINLEIL